MMSIKNPKISLLAATNLDQNSYHSILISLFRGLAALEVAAAHLRAQTLPSLKSLPDPNIWYQALSFFTGFAHQAVLIFFVLSGWLVGGSLLNKMHNSKVLLTYCIDRMTRLWIVLIPSFLVTIILGVLIGSIDPTEFNHSIGNEYSTRSFLGNLIGLQEFIVPDFGGNFSLWSLAYEIAYYTLFPLALMSFAAKNTTTRIISAIAAIIFASQLNGAVMLYFSVWMLGVAFSRIKIDVDQLSRTLLLAILVVAAVYFRLTGNNDIFTEKSFLQDLLYSFIFVLLLSSRQWTADVNLRSVRLYKAIGQFLAQFSFTLYVIHVPLLRYFKHLNKSFFGIEQLSPDKPLHFLIYFSMLMGIVLFSYVFYLLFEARTCKLRRHIKSAVLRRSFQFSKMNSLLGMKLGSISKGGGRR